MLGYREPDQRTLLALSSFPVLGMHRLTDMAVILWYKYGLYMALPCYCVMNSSVVLLASIHRSGYHKLTILDVHTQPEYFCMQEAS